MKRAHLLIIVFLGLFSGSCTNDPDTDLESIPISELKIEEELQTATMQLVNTYRISKNLGSLLYSEDAYKIALAHTQKMASEGRMTHEDFVSRAENLGTLVNAKAVAENLSNNFPTAQETFRQWLLSSKHRAAIVGDYTHSAVAVVTTPGGDVYYMQLFFKAGP
ncbi:CAP domain-containing protein [Robertkochia flava]|uniref:CAP domain-containing protein n=1 Tax=Robertkochia flava TaxID=3447986 RepID=UPI001CCFAEEB|nr:CAP domain-containing protein [Robertkochia marina]